MIYMYCLSVSWSALDFFFYRTDIQTVNLYNIIFFFAITFHTISGSPWREMISDYVIFFQESQDISKLYIKWWKEKSGGKCNIPKKKKASSLEVENVGGVFVVLLGGTGCGFLIALIEFLCRAFRNARADKVRKMLHMTYSHCKFGGNEIWRNLRENYFYI